MTRSTRSLLVFVCCAAGCSSNPNKHDTPVITVDTGVDANVDANANDAATPILPDRCTSGTFWTAGRKAFTNATDATNLTALDAEGVRILTVDVDGDGFSDLFIRKTGATSDDFTGTRATWLLHNKGDGTFEDVTQASGLVRGRFSPSADIGRPVEVAAFADVDNDGDLDAITAFSNDGSNPEGAEIMWNEGDGTFSLGPLDEPFRRAGEATSVSGLTWVDVDRDGRVDLWMGQGAVANQPLSDQLFMQQSDGTFVNATADRGVQTEDWTLAALNAGRAHTNAWSTAACDLDGDGNPELLAASYGRAPNKLFWNKGTTFENVSVASGYAFDQRTDWTDNESARCWCTLHPTDEDCAGVPAPRLIACNTDADAFRWNHSTDREPYRLGGNSGTTVCGDVDNDGDLDLLTTEIVHWDVGSSADPSELLYNDGASPPAFDRPGNDVTGLTRTHGQTWDDGDITGALFDFDNDGRLDVYIGSTDYGGTRALLYHQKVDGTFEAVPITDGIDHTSAHGVAVADYDHDGDLDIVLGHSRFRCSTGDHCYDSAHARYFQNEIGQDGNWVQLDLEGGDGSNRAAIGARVTVEADGVLQVREVGGGHGHYGIQHDLVQQVGLGASCTAKVTIRWPDADLTEQTFQVQSGYRYHVRQGAAPEPTNAE